MIEAAAFIGLAIVALTQLATYFIARDWKSAVKIGIAVFVGILVSLFDTTLGIMDVSVGQGIVFALDFIGIHTIARQIG